MVELDQDETMRAIWKGKAKAYKDYCPQNKNGEACWQCINECIYKALVEAWPKLIKRKDKK